MAYTTINKSTDYFNTKLYAGNSSTQSITGVGFQPDWVWIKDRDNSSRWHFVFDAVRGVNQRLVPNETSAEYTSTSLTAFDSDGFSLADQVNVNNNGNNYVAWNWKANGQGSSNTDGSINTTYTSVNATAGFSISKYTGTGANATVGHGLGAVPKWIIVKRLDSGTTNWQVYHSSMGAEKYIQLNTTSGQNDSDVLWNDTEPTNQVFSLGNYSHINNSGSPHIAYCFAEKTGYSKFSSYTGNGNVDSPFIYTGFKPAWIMIKKTSSGTGRGWFIFDNKRIGYNPKNYVLEANDTAADGTNDRIPSSPNGFKLRTTDLILNESGVNYIYMAFAEAPIVGTNNIPATAR
jgi:hypothetical protein